jgi:hypothetical protein
MRDSNESAVCERVPDRFAGAGERGDFQEYFGAEAKLRTGHHQLPIDSFDGHVFAGRPNVDRMPFRLQGTDPFERIHANGSLGSTMVNLVVMSIIYEP